MIRIGNTIRWLCRTTPHTVEAVRAALWSKFDLYVYGLPSLSSEHRSEAINWNLNRRQQDKKLIAFWLNGWNQFFVRCSRWPMIQLRIAFTRLWPKRQRNWTQHFILSRYLELGSDLAFFFSRRMNRIRSYNRRHLEVSNTGTTRICIIVTFFPSFRCGTQLMQRIRCTYDIISIYHTKCQMKKPVWGIRLKDKTYFRLFSLVVTVPPEVRTRACLCAVSVFFYFSVFLSFRFF